MELSHFQLILITGPPRSGTTILNRQLCEHSLVVPFLPECTYITQTIQQYANIVNYSDEKRFNAYFGTRELCHASFCCCIDSQIKTLVKSRNIDAKFQILVLKDPLLLLCADEAKELLPDNSKFIFIVRDPRSVIASMKQVVVRKSQKWDIVKVSYEILNYYARLLSIRENISMNDFIIKYEDFVSGNFDSLSDFVGFRVSYEMQESIGDELDSDDPFFTSLYSKPLTKERVVSWEGVLNHKELYIVSKIFKDVFSVFNYSLEISFWHRFIGFVYRVKYKLWNEIFIKK